MNDWELRLALACWWFAGFLGGYGVRGYIFSRQRKRIVDEMVEAIKAREVLK